MSIPKNAIKVFGWELYDVYQRNQQQFDGTYKIFEALKWKDASQILLIFDDWEVWIAYEEQPGRPPFFWLLGWVMEQWENPIHTINRELLEETWLGCDEIIPFKTFTQAKTIVRYFHCHLWRWVRYIQEPNEQSWEKVEVIKISVEELMQIMVGPYFRTKDFALDILKEYYKWWISRVRAILGIWDGIEEEKIEENIIPEIKSKKKTPSKKKTELTKSKKPPIKPKKIAVKTKPIKVKKTVIKKPIPLKKKDSLTSSKNKYIPKKTNDFKGFLKEMEKKIKKKEVEFEEPLF